jgi:DNA-directed RNA polymerase specialized sigma24 family protein
MLEAPDNSVRAPAEQGHGAVVLRNLEVNELIDLLNRLRLFAAKRYFGRLNVDDLAMQAITDTFTGNRSWNADYPPFENLCWIVRSIASNQLQKESRLSYDPDVETNSNQITSLPAQSSPSEIYETDEIRRDLRALFRRAVGDDGFLRQVVTLFLEKEVWKPKEMAVALNVSETEVYEAKRRIRRRLGKLLNKS